AFVPALDPSRKPLQRADGPSDPQYQAYLAVRRAVEASAYAEAFALLNSSPMYDILKILSNLEEDRMLNLLDNLLPSASGVNTPGRRVASTAAGAPWGASPGTVEAFKARNSRIFSARPADQQKDIEQFLAPPGEQGKPAETGGFLNGWWTVYDGNYYFYYFAL